MPCNLNFDTAAEIPSLAGKVILITGGTAGLGRETVLSFAGHDPAQIIFTGRSQSSADVLLAEVKAKYPKVPVTFISCDLASLASVQKAAKEIVSKTDRLDIAMMNAGIMSVPPALTRDGYEVQFGTNHVGHALLIKLLTPLMEFTAEEGSDVRVVWNTSQGYALHLKGGIFFDKVKTRQEDISWAGANWMRYGQSKLANLLYARAFANHHSNITSISIHPGVSATGLVTSLSFMQRMFIYATTIGKMLSAEDCAKNQQWAATAQKGSSTREVESGQYYEPIGVKKSPSGEGSNDELAEKLWQWTQEELKEYSL